ncbi:N-glycosylase/DNA lyase isoform X2 [Zootermopsis nevadensis]|uniref:N-glycosylase/DNA lyase n=1 Tax=Zootermopsis nevadensis TaxID=136037 RepID=A0A067QHL1_ZOONE|nr:N-glycosylase/DNA lyase isoform X2 [Zootermopsis nevadensis]KDR07858.1 N-glycosylase/DNA lyase [Zootermopsis nevadensis]
MWNKIPCARSELELLFTLCGGQCFRWKRTGDCEWTGVFANRVWTLSQNNESILYRVTKCPGLETSDEITRNTGKSNSRVQSVARKGRSMKKPMCEVTYTENDKIGDTTKTRSDQSSLEDDLLRKYFRLDVSLEEHYAQWSKKDPHFMEAAEKFTGVRILSQDPIENLFSFICSSNNNIARISSMVEKLCVLYGNKIADVSGTEYYGFPTLAALTDPSVEKSLRDAGFGYRAKFINQSACKIMQMGGSDWLDFLQSLSYEEAKVELMKLPGIGAKVADCICLMSLGHLEAIPVDTHIYQVAVQRYLPHLRGRKTVTDKMYNEIGDHFRALYGSLAGWAHTILFCADLKMFQDSAKQKLGLHDIKPQRKKRKQEQAL